MAMASRRAPWCNGRLREMDCACWVPEGLTGTGICLVVLVVLLQESHGLGALKKKPHHAAMPRPLPQYGSFSSQPIRFQDLLPGWEEKQDDTSEY